MRMVWRLVRDRRLTNPEVALALARVPRHLFLPEHLRHEAYHHGAVEVLDGQTMTCPGFVAQMTSLLEVRPGDRVLDVGTGTGYQAAVLAELGCEVTSVEILESMHRLGAANLRRGGYGVDTRLADGALGAPDYAPFDAIIMACATTKVPTTLLEQLKTGGVLVAPEGDPERVQTLVRYRRTTSSYEREAFRAAWFVAMTRFASSRA
jgi:protein-L-isoaspartate(D-aspartate) O-methyltransferase